MIYILIAVIILLVVSMFIFVYMFTKMKSRIDYLNTHYDYFERLININNESFKVLDGYVTRTLEREDDFIKTVSLIDDQYEGLKTQYETMLATNTETINELKKEYEIMRETVFDALKPWEIEGLEIEGS